MELNTHIHYTYFTIQHGNIKNGKICIFLPFAAKLAMLDSEQLLLQGRTFDLCYWTNDKPAQVASNKCHLHPLTCKASNHSLPRRRLDLCMRRHVSQTSYLALWGRGKVITRGGKGRTTPSLVRLTQDLTDVAEHVGFMQEDVVLGSEVEAPTSHCHLLERLRRIEMRMV